MLSMKSQSQHIPTDDKVKYFVRLCKKASTGLADIRGKTLGTTWLSHEDISKYFQFIQNELEMASPGIVYDGPFASEWVRILKLPSYLVVMK